jgi:DNA-binding NarL/FixJ family response regulator
VAATPAKKTPAKKTPAKKAILVCSRHAVTLAGFRAWLGDAPGYCVAECLDTAEMRDRLPAESAALLILDVHAGITLEFLAELRALAPATCVILWMEGISSEFVRQAIDAGVRGILNKNSTMETCLQCVRQVAAGQMWLEEELSMRLLCARTVKLTPREGQLVGLLTEGLRNKEIAWRMKITEGTAKAYLTRLYQKTGASDRFELALFAIRNLTIMPRGGSGDELGPAFRPASLAKVKTARG